jgi:hypothetical protein
MPARGNRLRQIWVTKGKSASRYYRYNRTWTWEQRRVAAAKADTREIGVISETTAFVLYAVGRAKIGVIDDKT